MSSQYVVAATSLSSEPTDDAGATICQTAAATAVLRYSGVFQPDGTNIVLFQVFVHKSLMFLKYHTTPVRVCPRSGAFFLRVKLCVCVCAFEAKVG